MSETLNSDDHRRYARQIALPEWGADGQIRLRRSRALIVGLGGLGSPVATYLAGAGVGHLTLNDFDRVDATNLPRQPLHDEASVGHSKTASAQRRISALNSTLCVSTIDQRLDLPALTEVIAQHDVVIDASDNFGTRFAINEAAVLSATPLVSAAAIRFEGQLAVFRADLEKKPCYACLYSADDDATEDCAGQGIMTPLVGVMGSMAAAEALKILLGSPPADTTWLHCVDLLDTQWRRLRISRAANCRVCSKV
ncbi:MAG: ThiF family adenylyltransferase [Gammaproteobacteria bacterium]